MATPIRFGFENVTIKKVFSIEETFYFLYKTPNVS